MQLERYKTPFHRSGHILCGFKNSVIEVVFCILVLVNSVAIVIFNFLLCTSLIHLYTTYEDICTSFIPAFVGTLFHVKHRRGDTEEDEDSLMYFIDVSNEGAGNSDQVLVLSSPINDITRQAWKVSQIRQFRITDLGVCIEFCPNCYRTHMPQYRSFNLFVRSSMINACIDFLCKKTKAVALKESTETFVTIYKLQNHKCPSITPPNTPPPQVPPKAPNVKPPMPPRTHPRLGCLNAPPAEPYLPPYSRMNPVKGWDDLVCPYKITNKIVVNNDGTVSYVSTVLGHSGSKTDLRPSITPQRGHRKPIQQEQQKPHQLTKRQMPSTNPHAKKQQLHKTESTAVPPRNIRRPAIMSPVMSPSLDSTDYPEEDYENQWPSEEFKRSVSSQEPEIMVSSPVKRKPLSYLEPVSTTLPIDDDKIGDDKDYVNADQIEFLASLKPPEKSMSPSSETSDDSDTGCKDYVNVPDVVSPDYMNIPDILLKMPVEEQNVTPLKVVRPTIKARTLPTATSESHKQESPTPNKRYTTNPPPVVDRTGQRAKSPAVSKHQQYQAESPAVSKHQQYQAETTKSPAVSKHQQYQAESPAVSKHQQYQAESPAVSKHQQYQAETTKSPAVSKHQQYQTETTKSPAVSKHQQYQAESPAVSKHQQYQTETTKSPAVSKHQQYQTETAKSPAVSKHQQYQAETTKSPAVTRNQQSEIPSNHTGRLENTIMVNQLVSQPQAANRPSMTPVNITSKSKKSESSSLNMAKGSSPPVSAKPPQKVTNPQMATGAPLPSSQEQVNVKQSYQNTVAVDTKVRGAETTTLEQRLQQSYPTTPTVPQLKSHNKSPKVSTKPVSRLKDIESSSPNTVKNSGPPPVAMKPAKQVNQNTEEIENKVFVSIPVDQHTSTPAVQTSSTRPITNATNAVKQMASQLNAGPIKTKQSPKVPVRRSSLSNEGSPKAVNPSQQLSQSYKQEQSVTSPTTKRPARKAPAPPKKQSSGSKFEVEMIFNSV